MLVLLIILLAVEMIASLVLVITGGGTMFWGLPVDIWTMQIGYWLVMLLWYTIWAVGFDHVVGRDEIAELMGEDFARRVWK